MLELLRVPLRLGCVDAVLIEVLDIVITLVGLESIVDSHAEHGRICIMRNLIVHELTSDAVLAEPTEVVAVAWPGLVPGMKMRLGQELFFTVSEAAL